MGEQDLIDSGADTVSEGTGEEVSVYPCDYETVLAEIDGDIGTISTSETPAALVKIFERDGVTYTFVIKSIGRYAEGMDKQVFHIAIFRLCVELETIETGILNNNGSPPDDNYWDTPFYLGSGITGIPGVNLGRSYAICNFPYFSLSEKGLRELCEIMIRGFYGIEK